MLAASCTLALYADGYARNGAVVRCHLFYYSMIIDRGINYIAYLPAAFTEKVLVRGTQSVITRFLRVDGKAADQAGRNQGIEYGIDSRQRE